MILIASCLCLLSTGVFSYPSQTPSLPVRQNNDQFELSTDFLSHYLGPDFKDAVHYNLQQSDFINAGTGRQFKESSSYKMQVPQLVGQQGQTPGSVIKVKLLPPGELEALERGINKAHVSKSRDFRTHPSKSATGVKATNSAPPHQMVNGVHANSQKVVHGNILNQKYQAFDPQDSIKRNQPRMGHDTVISAEPPKEQILKKPLHAEKTLNIPHQSNFQSSEESDEQFVPLSFDKPAPQIQQHLNPKNNNQFTHNKPLQNPSIKSTVQQPIKITPTPSEEKSVSLSFDKLVPTPQRTSIEGTPQHLNPKEIQLSHNKPTQTPLSKTVVHQPAKITPTSFKSKENEQILPISQETMRKKFPAMQIPFGRQIPFEERPITTNQRQPILYKVTQPTSNEQSFNLSQDRFKEFLRQRSMENPAIKQQSNEPTSQSTHTKPFRPAPTDRIEPSEEMSQPLYEVVEPSSKVNPHAHKTTHPNLRGIQTSIPKMTYFPFDEKRTSNHPTQSPIVDSQRPLQQKIVRQQRSFKTPAIEKSSFEISQDQNDQSSPKDNMQLTANALEQNLQPPTENIPPAFENTQNFYATYFPFEERGFSYNSQQQLGHRFAEEARNNDNTQDLKELKSFLEATSKTSYVPEKPMIEDKKTDKLSSNDNSQLQEQNGGLLFQPIIYFIEKPTPTHQNQHNPQSD